MFRLYWLNVQNINIGPQGQINIPAAPITRITTTSSPNIIFSFFNTSTLIITLSTNKKGEKKGTMTAKIII